MVGWTAEDRTEVEEEEEEEESGSLDEEEIKKMQSDEVCGDSPSGGSAVGSVLFLFHSPPCPLGHSGPGGDSL